MPKDWLNNLMLITIYKFDSFNLVTLQTNAKMVVLKENLFLYYLKIQTRLCAYTYGNKFCF